EAGGEALAAGIGVVWRAEEGLSVCGKRIRKPVQRSTRLVARVSKLDGEEAPASVGLAGHVEETRVARRVPARIHQGLGGAQLEGRHVDTRVGAARHDGLE